MMGVAGPDLYWMRLGPVELSPMVQAHIHVRISLQDRLRLVYVAHEFLRRPNPKARWSQGEVVQIPLDPAARAQITLLVMYALWTLLISDLSVESLADLQLEAAVRGPLADMVLLPPAAEPLTAETEPEP